MAKARQSAESGQHPKLPRYEVGNQVWVSKKPWVDAYNKTRPSAKLAARWFGPYRISKLIRRNAVKLELPTYMKAHNVVHVSLTKPAINKPPALAEEVHNRPETI